MEGNLKSLKNIKLNVSFSRLNTYSRCQRRYYFEYVMGLRGESSEALANGTLTHDILADDECDEIPDNTPEDVAEWVRRGDVFLRGLELAGAEVEKEREFHIQLTRSITLNGAIDVIVKQGDRISIVDYKTNRQMYDTEDTLQTKTYATALFKLNPKIKKITAMLFFLRYNQMVPVVYTRKIITPTLNFYKSVGAEIVSKLPIGYMAFDQNENYCDSCPGAIMCHLTDPKNDNDYNQLAGWAMRGNAAIGQAKNMLKPFVLEHGSITVGEKEWRFNPVSPSKVFDIELLKDRIDEMGVNFADVFSVNSKTIKSLPEELITGTYTEKQNSPKFGLFKKT